MLIMLTCLFQSVILFCVALMCEHHFNAVTGRSGTSLNYFTIYMVLCIIIFLIIYFVYEIVTYTYSMASVKL